MSPPGVSPYEADVLGQPGALRALLGAAPPGGLGDLRAGTTSVLLTGMGTSHFAALPTWRALAPTTDAWWLSTSELLDTPGAVRRDSLVWVTSQSGRSGEVAALLERLGDRRPRRLLATTNDVDSPLARDADAVVPLHAGHEASVSTKSYLNTLLAHALTLAALTGAPDGAVREAVEGALDALPRLVADDPLYDELAARTLDAAVPRLALVGTGDHAATALTGALVLKEASKVPAEGFVGGAFRHGPMELAGPGLTALLLTGDDDGARVLPRLAADLADTGSLVVSVGPEALVGAHHHVPVPGGAPLGQLLTSIVPVQRLSIALARRAGLEPGAFRFGAKVTAVL